MQMTTLLENTIEGRVDLLSLVYGASTQKCHFVPKKIEMVIV